MDGQIASETRDGWQPQARLLRVIALIWLGYVAALAFSDQAVLAIRPLRAPQLPSLPLYYYATQALAALAVLAAASGARLRAAADNAEAGAGSSGALVRLRMPLIIVWMVSVPTLITRAMAGSLPPGPMTSAEGLLLRLLPVLLMALMLVSWQYRWRHVVGFSLAAVGLELIPTSLREPAFIAPIDPLLLACAIQTISFLTVGYGMCALMDHVRRQHAALEQANAQVRHYASTLEHLAMSRERNRVARELHDTLAHTLSGLAVQLEATKVAVERGPQATHEMLDTALGTARSGLQETRRSLNALRASPLDELGLFAALRDLAEQAAARANLRLTVAISPRLPTMAPDVEHAIYRIAQEAVANATYHANASALALRLDPDGDRISLSVADDGAGFDPRQNASAGHYGLAGMRERAAFVGGQLAVNSRPAGGTTVTFTI